MLNTVWDTLFLGCLKMSKASYPRFLFRTIPQQYFYFFLVQAYNPASG